MIRAADGWAVVDSTHRMAFAECLEKDAAQSNRYTGKRAVMRIKSKGRELVRRE